MRIHTAFVLLLICIILISTSATSQVLSRPQTQQTSITTPATSLSLSSTTRDHLIAHGLPFTSLAEEGGEGEGEGGEGGEGEASGGSLNNVILILGAIFLILIIILLVAVFTEVHMIICGFIARRREAKREVTSSERFQNQLASTVHWEKMPPGERSHLAF